MIKKIIATTLGIIMIMTQFVVITAQSNNFADTLSTVNTDNNISRSNTENEKKIIKKN